MEKKTEFKSNIKFLVVMALIILFLPVLGLIHELFLGNRPNLSYEEYSSMHATGGWEYIWADGHFSDSDYLSEGQNTPAGLQWKPISHPINPPDRDGRDYIWFRYPLPDGGWDKPTVLISRLGVLLAFDAFVDGVNVYSFGKDYSLGLGNFPGLTSHLIPLEKHMQGKTLILKVFSDYGNIGVRGKIILGEKADLISAIIKQDIIKFVISFFMVMIGLMDLITYRKGEHNTNTISMFGILAISMGFYIINLTTLKDLIFFAPMFWYAIFITTMTLIPIGTVGFSWETFRPFKNHFLYKILIFQIVFGLVCQIAFVLISYRWISMDIGTYFLHTERIIMFILITILIVIAVKDAVGKKSLMAKIYLAGVSPIIVFSLYDIMAGLGWILPKVSYSPFGILLFILSLEMIKRDINTRTHNKLRIYSKELELRSREKEALITDLHDGIGGLITNIKFISEMGLHRSTNPKTAEAFKTISSLSSDSLIEIGNFMQSLDQKADWETIEKKMRALGNEMVVQMGMRFHLKSRITLNAILPESILFLNLLRIYKEALTNIIKHAGAENVIITLLVNSKNITLSIQDDGRGFKQGRKEGRGLKSMKMRARKLGGDMEVHSEDGTLILFTLCVDKGTALAK